VLEKRVDPLGNATSYVYNSQLLPIKNLRSSPCPVAKLAVCRTTGANSLPGNRSGSGGIWR